jgi:hypothetical protein
MTPYAYDRDVWGPVIAWGFIAVIACGWWGLYLHLGWE